MHRFSGGFNPLSRPNVLFVTFEHTAAGVAESNQMEVARDRLPPVIDSRNPPREIWVATTICEVRARQILDSRGNPTVEADVGLTGRSGRPRRGPLGGIDRHARGRGVAR